jgi:hypothetical protein
VVIPAPLTGRDAARDLARRELSKAIYRQLPVRGGLEGAIGRLLQHAFSAASRVSPGGWWTLVAVLAVIAALAVLILARIGPVAGPGRRGALAEPRGGGRPPTARQLRDQAEASAAGGDYSTAIVQRLRAIAVSCEERGVLVPDAGRTADELAAQAGACFPGHGPALAEAARLFDRVRYGGGTGTAAGYQRLRELDAALASAGAPAPGAAAAAARSAP